MRDKPTAARPRRPTDGSTFPGSRAILRVSRLSWIVRGPDLGFEHSCIFCSFGFRIGVVGGVLVYERLYLQVPSDHGVGFIPNPKVGVRLGHDQRRVDLSIGGVVYCT